MRFLESQGLLQKIKVSIKKTVRRQISSALTLAFIGACPALAQARSSCEVLFTNSSSQSNLRTVTGKATATAVDFGVELKLQAPLRLEVHGPAAKITVPITIPPTALGSENFAKDYVIGRNQILAMREPLPKAFRLNPLLGASMETVRQVFDDSEAVAKYTSLDFIVSGTAAPARVKMSLVTNVTRRLTKELGHEVRYEAEFATSSKTDWVSIRYSDLRLVGAVAEKSFDKIPQKPLSFSFETIDSLEPITIQPDISFSLDIPTAELPDVIDRLRIRRSVHKSRLDAVSDQEIRTVLKKFVTSQQRAENQAYAVDIINGGLDSVRSALRPYGWMVRSELKNKVSMGSIMVRLSSLDLFYEGGDFGPLHGSFAHHAQFLAGFRDLAPAEAGIVTDFVRYLIADPSQSSRWGLWNVLFDSRGDGVNSNRFWRDQILKADVR